MSNPIPWQGTWNSTYAPLRLVQDGKRVYGDYGDLGPIEATVVAPGRIAGTFENHGKPGRIEFELNGDTFVGKWAWGQADPDRSWQGRRTSEERPTLKFTRNGDGDATAAPWQGTWKTTYAELRLRQEGNRVFGDYGTLGPIEGTYDPHTRKLTGTFYNNGRQGRIVWTLTGDAFSGHWAWDNGTPHTAWNGTRSSRQRPAELRFVDGNRIVVDRDPPKPDPKPDPKPTGPVRDIDGSNARVVRNGRETEKRGTPSQVKSVKRPDGYVCVTTKENVDATFNKNYILANSQSYLYPGSIIDGREYSQGRITPVDGVRQPFTISPNYGGQSVRVEQPSLSGVRDALVRTLPRGTAPSTVQFESTTVESSEEIRLLLQAGYDDGLNKVKVSGGFHSTKRRSTVAVRMLQLYYTVDVDRPAVLTNESIFKDGTTISPHHLIVDQVGYGRLAVLLIETDYSAEEIKAALDYYGDQVTSEVSASVKAKYSKVMATSSFNAFVLGGSGIAAARLIASSGQGIKQFLLEGAEYGKDSPGAPIFYKMRFLKDWSEAGVNFSTTVHTTVCTQTAGVFDAGFDWVGVVEEDDDGNNEEIYGIGWLRCWVKDKGATTYRRISPTNFKYLDRHGRVLEILPDRHKSISKGDAAPLMSNRLRFDLDARTYGYGSFDELANNAYLEFAFEVKEQDDGFNDDDMLGKQSRKIYLKDANIERVTSRSQVVKQHHHPGALTGFMDGGSRAIVLFSVQPVTG